MATTEEGVEFLHRNITGIKGQFQFMITLYLIVSKEKEISWYIAPYKVMIVMKYS